MANISKTLAGAAYGPSDSPKVMEMTLKLRADDGNAAVLKQLTSQVHDAFAKVVKETEQVGAKLVDKAQEWGKSMGESIRKSVEKAASDAEKSVRKEAPEPKPAAAEKQAPAGREVPAHQDVTQPKSAPTSAEATRPQEQPEAKKPEASPAKEEKSATEKGLTLFQKSTGAAKHISEVASSEKTPVERLSAGADAAVEINEAAKSAKGIFSTVKNVATAGKPIAEVGIGGMALNLAKGGLASLGGGGGIAAAAQVTGIGALAIGGGVAVHDGFKLLLNKVGILGGHFDTLSGTVLEWNESTKKSAEIEKKIAETQEAHQQALEQMQRNQQNTRSVYEARGRIEESEKVQKEAASMVPVGAHYAKRLKEIDPQHVATERELQKRDQAYAISDRAFAKEQYAISFREKEREQQEAAGTASETDKRNKQPQRNSGGSRTELASDGSQGTIHASVVDLQEQVLQEEKSVKLANELRDLAKARTTELQSQLTAMDQQVRAAEHQVAAARDQVKAEQDKVTAQKAVLSMLSHDQQKSAADILKKFNDTKHLSRADALTLQKRGITQGRIGTAINETLAQGLDPELAKQIKAAGGEEGLDKAQQQLAESTNALAEAQQQAKQTLQEYMAAIRQFAKSADTAVGAQKHLEDTRSRKEGYSNPEMLRPGEKPHATTSAVEMMKAAIEAANADFGEAMKEVTKAVVNGLKRQAAETSRNAQMLHNAQQH